MGNSRRLPISRFTWGAVRGCLLEAAVALPFNIEAHTRKATQTNPPSKKPLTGTVGNIGHRTDASVESGESD